MLGDTVGFNKWLAQFGREINPTATLVPVNDPDACKTISTEIADIEKMMGDQSSEYWRGPKSAQLQTRYRELTEASEKMKTRGRAA
jgi:hypothetical protein